jgi:hypothetical protein
MSTPEKRVSFELDGKIDGLLNTLATAQRATKDSVDGISSQFTRLGGGLSSMIGTFGVLGGILAGGAGFKSMISTTQSVVGEVTRLSKVLGITAQESSVLRIALDDAFLSVEDMTAGSNRITKQLLSNEAAFRKLGVATRDSNGNYRDTFSIMMDTNTALSKIKAGTDQNVAGMSIYGKAWGEARNLMKLTHEAMAEARDRAEELHLVIGPEGQKQVKEYKLAMKDLDDVSESLKVTIGKELIPVLTDLGVAFGTAGTSAAGFFAKVMHEGTKNLSMDKAWLSRQAARIPTDSELAGDWKEYEARQAAADKLYQWSLEKKSERYGGLTGDLNRAIAPVKKEGSKFDGASSPSEKKNYTEDSPGFMGWRRRQEDEKEELAWLTERNKELEKAKDDLKKIYSEMAVDEIENGLMKSDGYLNEVGKMSDKQQAAFDQSALVSSWAARNKTSDQEASRNGMGIMAQGIGGNTIEMVKLDEEREAAIQGWAMMTDSFEVYEARKTMIEQVYSDKRRKIEQDEQSKKMGIAASGFANMASVADSFYQLSHNKSKVALKAYQVMKSGETVISTADSAMKAYSAMAGIPYVGPALGAAAAAAAVAAGAVQLQSIWSIGSDGSGGAVNAGASTGTSSASSAVVAQPASNSAASNLSVTVQVQGNVISDDRWVEERLAPAIRDLALNRNVSFGFATSTN